MVPESPRERSSTKKCDRTRKLPENSGEATPQETLRMHLGALSSEDPDCIFVCRRVNHLGFHSRELLRQHFASYGPVSRVYVAHMKVKSRATATVGRRVRPGGLGIVVMQNAEDAKRILEGHEEQEIDGHKIRIGPFEQPTQKSRENDTYDTTFSEDEAEDSGNVSTQAEGSCSNSHGFDSTSNGGSNNGGSGSNGSRSNGTSNVGSSNVGSNGSEDSNGASNGSGSGSDRSGANGSDPGANGSDQSQPDQNGSDSNSSPSGGASD